MRLIMHEETQRIVGGTVEGVVYVNAVPVDPYPVPVPAPDWYGATGGFDPNQLMVEY